MLRGTRQVPPRKAPDPDSRNTTQQKKYEKERAGEGRKRPPVELKGKFLEIHVNVVFTKLTII